MSLFFCTIELLKGDRLRKLPVPLPFLPLADKQTNILVDAATANVLTRIKDLRSGAEGNTLGSKNMTKAFIVQAQDEGEELAEFISDLF